MSDAIRDLLLLALGFALGRMSWAALLTEWKRNWRQDPLACVGYIALVAVMILAVVWNPMRP